MTDLNGDGMLGSNYYNRGHVTFRRSWLGSALTLVVVAGLAFITLVVLGSLLNIKPAQGFIETVIAGRQ